MLTASLLTKATKRCNLLSAMEKQLARSDFEKFCEYMAGSEDEGLRAEVSARLRDPNDPMRVLVDHVSAVSRQWFGSMLKCKEESLGAQNADIGESERGARPN